MRNMAGGTLDEIAKLSLISSSTSVTLKIFLKIFQASPYTLFRHNVFTHLLKYTIAVFSPSYQVYTHSFLYLYICIRFRDFHDSHKFYPFILFCWPPAQFVHPICQSLKFSSPGRLSVDNG